MSRTTNYIDLPAYVRPLIYFEDLKPETIRRLMTQTNSDATVSKIIGGRISPENRENAGRIHSIHTTHTELQKRV